MSNDKNKSEANDKVRQQPELISELTELAARRKVTKVSLNINIAEFIMDQINALRIEAEGQGVAISKQGFIEFGLVKGLGLEVPSGYRFR